MVVDDRGDACQKGQASGHVEVQVKRLVEPVDRESPRRLIGAHPLSAVPKD